MHLLYGVVGEGMGHATRSRVIIAHLLQRGHSIRVVVSGNAHSFLATAFANNPHISIEEIHGFTLALASNELDISETVRENIEAAPESLAHNVSKFAQEALAGYQPDAIVSDFESWAYLYGVLNNISVVSIDNMQIINRCTHEPDVTDDESFSFWLAKMAVKAKLPGAYHYLITSFFYPEVRKPRTSLVPPILRPEILRAKRQPGEHVLVYQKASTQADLLEILHGIPGQRFRVYGMKETGSSKNVELCAFSETRFVEDLRTAKAVVGAAGYSLMGECVHLGVPMLSVPIRGQFEQELNARYLSKLGYGLWSPLLTRETLQEFLANASQFEERLKTYARTDNEMTLRCVDEVLEAIATGTPRPDRLSSPNRGQFSGSM